MFINVGNIEQAKCYFVTGQGDFETKILGLEKLLNKSS